MLTQQGMFGIMGPGFSAYSSAGVLGLLINKTAFAGLQFYVGSDVYYGLIKFQEIPALAGGGIVYEYAYDIRPNTPIVAGTVPEPSVFALFGLSTLMLYAARRKMVLPQFDGFPSWFAADKMVKRRS